MNLYKKAWLVTVSAFARVSENVAHLIALCSTGFTFFFLMNGKETLYVTLPAGLAVISTIVATISGYARRYLDTLERNTVKRELNDIQSQMRELREYTKARVISDEAKAILVEHLKKSVSRPAISFTYDNAFDSASTALMFIKIFRECGWTAFDAGPLMVGQSDARDLLVCVNSQNRSFAEIFASWLNESGFPTRWTAFMQDPPVGQYRIVIYRTSNKLGS